MMFFDNRLEAVVYPVIVALICFAIYMVAMNSDTVQYRDEKEREHKTRWQRKILHIVGFVVGLSGFFLLSELVA